MFVDNEGVSASPGEANQLRIYCRKQGVWQIDREMEIDLGRAKDLAAMRQAMGAVVAFLGECGLVAAENFQGAALHELEKTGKGMWEVRGLPEPPLLDHILTEEENAGGTDLNGAATVYPRPGKPGRRESIHIYCRIAAQRRRADIQTGAFTGFSEGQVL